MRVWLGVIGAFALGAFAAPGVAPASCVNESLRLELGVQQLPDCRAYELVSPPYKQGDVVIPRTRSVDGDRLVFDTLGVIGGAENDYVLAPGAVYEATRDSVGWLTRPIVPPASSFPGYVHLDDSTTQALSLWRLRPSSESEEEGAGPLYIRQPDSSLVEVGPAAPSKPEAVEPQYMGASQDLSHVVFEMSATQDGGKGLWPGDATVTGQSLYEYSGVSHSEPSLVGVLNEGPLAANAQATQISLCGTELGSRQSTDTYNAISEEGNSVFFTALAAPACGTPHVDELYVRIDGERTVAISEPSLSTPGRECDGVCREDEEVEAKRGEGQFQGASGDGTKVFFATAQPLLNTDKDNRRDLYEADLEGGRVARLTQVSLASAGAGELVGVARVSQDGSRVYFVAAGILTGIPNSLGQTAQVNAANLYVYEPDGSGGHRVAFVAELCTGPSLSRGVADPQCHGSDAADWAAIDERPVQATADGRFFVFPSRGDLTPDDTSTAAQLFEYDAQAGSLTRVSVAHDRLGSDGNLESEAEAPQLSVAHYARAFNPRSAQTLATSVTSDGAVVFTSSAQLSAEAAPGVTNVYEYREGNVYLISDGHDSAMVVAKPAVQLFGTDASGGDVFFTTADALLAQDVDTQQDLYDARTGGGFSPPAASATGCSEEDCQGPASLGPPLPVATGSATAAPGENLAATPAPVKGKAKRRCKVIRHHRKRVRVCRRVVRHRHKRAHKHTSSVGARRGKR